MKKRVQKSVSLFLVAIFSVGIFTACQKTPSQETIETTANSSSDLIYEITDWTMEDLITDMEICGQKISLPCSVADMENGFKLKDEPTYIESDNFTADSLYYEDSYVATVYVNGNIDKTIKDNNIALLFISDGMGENKNGISEFNIMGITDKSSAEDVIKILGEPNVSEGTRSYRYFFNDHEHIAILFDENDMIKAVSVYYNKMAN
ncbi:MAG: hypothetical protein IKK32_05610 [Oscillospiraceae bacterium]|mgnify:CR=1 FL=1|nr:hypothetical protein [Oscillospiraceae bacterium]